MKKPTKQTAKTSVTVSSERVVADIRSRFNPITNLTAQTLVTRLSEWQYGYLSQMAQTMAVVEERDENIATVAPNRYEAAARLPWDVVIVEGEQENPEAKRQRAYLLHFYNNVTATDVTDLHIRGGVSVLLRQIARAIGHKWSVHEIVYRPLPVMFKNRDGVIVMTSGLTAEFRFVPLWYFEKTENRLKYLPINSGGVNGQDLEQDGWLVASGRGLLIPSVINYLFQRMSLNDWLQFNKDFGSGFIDAATDAEKGSAEWNSIRNDLAALFRAKAMLHGKGATLNFENPPGGTATFDEILDRLEKKVLRLWTGSDLATQSSATSATGSQPQQNTVSSILKSDASWLAEVAQQYIDRAVIRYYDGDAAAESPLAYFKLIVPEAKDQAPELAVDKFLIGAGAKMKLGGIAERYNRTVENGDDVALTGQIGTALTADPALPLANERNTFDAAARSQLAAAVAEDLSPVADRLRAILAIEDEQTMMSELSALQSELPKVMFAGRDSKSAIVLQRIIGTALVEGLTKS